MTTRYPTWCTVATARESLGHIRDRWPMYAVTREGLVCTVAHLVDSCVVVDGSTYSALRRSNAATYDDLAQPADETYAHTVVDRALALLDRSPVRLCPTETP